NHDNPRGCGGGYKNKSMKRMKSRKTVVKASIAEKRARDRALGRFYRTTLKASKKLKKGIL
ncbi:MAG: hypothetical protein P8163_22795, partial [Candidatus Thiodiazotropha sp.]